MFKRAAAANISVARKISFRDIIGFLDPELDEEFECLEPPS